MILHKYNRVYRGRFPGSYFLCSLSETRGPMILAEATWMNTKLPPPRLIRLQVVSKSHSLLVNFRSSLTWSMANFSAQAILTVLVGPLDPLNSMVTARRISRSITKWISPWNGQKHVYGEVKIAQQTRNNSSTISMHGITLIANWIWFVTECEKRSFRRSRPDSVNQKKKLTSILQNN